MAHDLFISYSSKDKLVADAVCASLEAAKIRCWITPRDILPGQDWAEAIEGALTKSKLLVLIFSSYSNNSKQVAREVSLAFNSEVTVIPFRIEDIEPKGAMKYYLLSTHWQDALTSPMENNIKKLVEIVSNFIGKKIDDIKEVDKKRKEVKRETRKPEVSKAIKTKPDKAAADKEQIYRDDKKQNAKKRISWNRLKKKNKILIIVLPVILVIALTIFLVGRFILIDNDIGEVVEKEEIAVETVIEEVANEIPTASPGGPYTATAGREITFDGSGSSDPDGSIVEYIWDFGDGSDYTGSEEIITHVYDQKGNYTIELTVVDDKGDISVASVTVAITEILDKIAFSSIRDGDDEEIYIMNPDGSDVTQLTDNDHLDFAPCWSPDSSRIAFSSNRDGDVEIYIMDSDGSNQVQLTDNDSDDVNPSFSPDGSSIAFCSGGTADWGDFEGFAGFEIYTMNTDGSDVTQLTDNDHVDFAPCWSPDSSRLAFCSDRDGDFEIYTMNPDGSGVTQLTDNDYSDWYPSFSPDGSRIAFVLWRDENSEIYIMNADGSGVQQLTDNDYNDWTPSFSPDGSRIAFSSDRDGDEEIYTMNPDGSDVTQLTDNDYIDAVPSWSK
ncbi:MAG: PKD domain-containing protein [Actinobacteria bacterium]|nr:PKD domain-containing protein [Actinomycetota bacterium]